MSLRISTERADIDVDLVHRFLHEDAYWCRGVPRAVLETAIANSLCFSAFVDDRQIGFARVITDRATFAYLCDVFVSEAERGAGLGQWLVECVLAHPELQGLRRFCLMTKDAHALYRRFGFAPMGDATRYLEIHRADAYGAG